MRAPHTTREKPSRPRSSVPNGRAHVGALRIWLQSVRTGSVMAIQGAPSDMTTNRSTPTAPASAAGRRRPTRQARCGAPERAAGASASASGKVGLAASGAIDATVDADPRVQHGVRDVDQQIDEDVRRGRDEHHALHDGVVAGEDRLDDEATEARQHEDRDRKSTRLNSSHTVISYAVFCLKKKKKKKQTALQKNT